MHIIVCANYKKLDLNKVMIEQCQDLSTKEHEVLALLRKFEDMSYGTLCTWNTNLVDLELNYDSKHV